ncbi:MAG: nuclear transport factor 2 family protein [Bacteroidota bacterium]|nr:nuclear transport factor 2 family protein [Bacteroidota bacterium]
MKKAIMFMLAAFTTSTALLAQTPVSKNTKMETQIIALEKAGWQAWKNKDAAWFKTNLADDFIMVNADGVGNKAQVVKSTPTDCMVKSFSLDNFKFVRLNEGAGLLTYTAMQDAVCSGKTIPAKVRATVTYVKRGGKWLEAMYMETSMTQ